MSSSREYFSYFDFLVSASSVWFGASEGLSQTTVEQTFLFVQYGQTGMSDLPVVVKVG